jgi:hypothetical protein
MTIGTALAGAAATTGLGWLAAVTHPGTATTVANVGTTTTTTTSGTSGSTGTTSTTSGAVVSPTATPTPTPTTTTNVSSTTRGGHVSTGGS